jgi:hypothetical protein
MENAKMSNLEWIRSNDGTVIIFCDNQLFTVAGDSPSRQLISNGLSSGTLTPDRLYELLNIRKSVNEVAKFASAGKVEVNLEAGKVWYDGVEFPDKGLCDRILRLMAEGQPFQYMVNFLERLGKNPNFRSVMELFKFITKKGFPITPEGKILAYKGVRDDWKDVRSGKFDNSVGTTNEMDRKDGDDNHRQDCSYGFHVGTHGYAVSFGPKVVLVEVDPVDVICVPSVETDKMRCCKYRVIADHTNQGLLTGEVYDSTGKRVLASTYGQFDNPTASHWEDGRTYGDGDAYDEDDDYEEEEEECEHCGNLVCDCICLEDDEYDE